MIRWNMKEALWIDNKISLDTAIMNKTSSPYIQVVLFFIEIWFSCRRLVFKLVSCANYWSITHPDHMRIRSEKASLNIQLPNGITRLHGNRTFTKWANEAPSNATESKMKVAAVGYSRVDRRNDTCGTAGTWVSAIPETLASVAEPVAIGSM